MSQMCKITAIFTLIAINSVFTLIAINSVYYINSDPISVHNYEKNCELKALDLMKLINVDTVVYSCTKTRQA